MDHQILLHQLTELLNKGHAHVTFEEAVEGIPSNLRGVKASQMPYSIWQLVEHIRIAQWDILKFSEGPDHQSPQWPAGYWPASEAPDSGEAWSQSLREIQADKQAFIELLHSRQAQLLEPFPYGSGQTLLREAFLIADHTSYHTGQIVLLRRLLGNWQD